MGFTQRVAVTVLTDYIQGMGEIQMMARVEGVFLKNEQGVKKDVSNEVVAWSLKGTEPASPWTLTIEFGLEGHREGFVGHRYSVEIPVGAARFTRRQSTDSGYQLGGTLHITHGRVVIDDPLTRPKPPSRIWYERA